MRVDDNQQLCPGRLAESHPTILVIAVITIIIIITTIIIVGFDSDGFIRNYAVRVCSCWNNRSTINK